MNIEPIGFIRTCFGSKFAVPRQPGLCPSAWGVLELAENFRSPEAVRGLEGFSHLRLIFGFHETEIEGWHPTVRPPRLGGNERVGVFASRSTYRPNALGLSLVRLDRVEFKSSENLKPPLIHVSGVDLIDHTPIFDIKPYLPYAESVDDATGGYAAESIPRFEVKVEDHLIATFSALAARSQQVIREVLALDPRPAVSPKRDQKSYGAVLCGYNVKFRFKDAICWIVAIDLLK